MELKHDFLIEQWLREFIPESNNFDWDKGNQEKNLKHFVDWKDIESIFSNIFVFEGEILIPIHWEKRYLMLGIDRHTRSLALIFTVRNNKLRPVCCRTMRKKERERYEKRTQEI